MKCNLDFQHVVPVSGWAHISAFEFLILSLLTKRNLLPYD